MEEIQQSKRVDDDGGGGVGGGRCRRSGHRSCDKHRRDDEAGIGVGDGAIGSRRREHPRGDDKKGRNRRFDGSGRREMRVIGGGEGTLVSTEGGRQREQAGRGGEGEAAAMDANCQGQDGNAANREMIRKTAKEKEKEKEWATHDAATEGRRKRRKSRHCRLLSSSEEDDEEEAGRRTREPTQRRRRRRQQWMRTRPKLSPQSTSDA